MPRLRRCVRLCAGVAGACAIIGATVSPPAAAESLRLCDHPKPATAAQQDRLLRFAAIARGELEASGDAVAIVARSGLNLTRFGLRYSHAGISLRASDHTPWSVRQLYYACDERRPRLFDQGLAGFVFGTDDPGSGYLSIVLLPREAAAALERAALDKPLAQALLGDTYSANAYAFGLRYQNCNQWLVELLGSAWGDLAPTADGDAGLRERAQRWLAAAGYAPPPIAVNSHLLMFAGGFVPWLRYDDHPDDDRWAMRFRVSVPGAIEDFVHAREPRARRIELCHAEGRVVVRHGWRPLPEGCVAEADDRVVTLD